MRFVPERGSEGERERGHRHVDTSGDAQVVAGQPGGSDAEPSSGWKQENPVDGVAKCGADAWA